MSEKELREMLDFTSNFAVTFFNKNGEMSPMWHSVTASGEQIIITEAPFPDDKDLSAAMIRALFQLHDVIRFVFVCEAWTVVAAGDEIAEIRHRRVRDDPRRIEVVAFLGEDRECGQLTARCRIMRPQNAKPYLGPLEVDEMWTMSEGRLVGLLPVKGTVQ